MRESICACVYLDSSQDAVSSPIPSFSFLGALRLNGFDGSSSKAAMHRTCAKKYDQAHERDRGLAEYRLGVLILSSHPFCDFCHKNALAAFVARG